MNQESVMQELDKGMVAGLGLLARGSPQKTYSTNPEGSRLWQLTTGWQFNFFKLLKAVIYLLSYLQHARMCVFPENCKWRRGTLLSI